MGEDRVARITNAMVGEGYGPPVDVVRRIDALLSHEDEAYVDVRFTLGDDSVSGVAVVFTETRVLLASWSRPISRLPGQLYEPNVKVETWPRKRLVAASIAIVKDRSANRDADWNQDWGDQWPQGAAMTLQYEHQLPQLVLPLKPEGPPSVRIRFQRFVPSILADLTR